MKTRILIDTGPLVAILSRKDSSHKVCTETLSLLNPPLVTSWLVITEVHWLLRGDPPAVKSLFTALKEGFVKILDLDDDAVTWLENFLEKYENIDAQIADASLMYLAETYKIRSIFTLDKKDFSVYRTTDKKTLQLLPL